MSNEKGNVWIVFNGEIYNFRNLRSELRDQHVFRSSTDTEVILHAYEELGMELIPRLDGMFSMAIVDLTRHKLFLIGARSFGIKPLHYVLNQDEIVFASEIKAIVAGHGTAGRLDATAINDFFEYQWIPGPHTVYEDVKKLPPGCWMELNWATWETAHASLLAAGVCPRDRSASCRVGRSGVEHELQASVQRQLVADVNSGAFLSGGIDSTLVATYAADRRGSSFKTFTIDFEDKSHSEGEKAREVVRTLGIDGVFRTLPPSRLDDLERLAYFYDEPFADSSLLPTVAVSEVARESVKVVLSGDGGDELFSGYKHHALAYRLSRFDFVPNAWMKTMFGAGRKILPRSTRWYEWCQRLGQSADRRRLTLLRMPGRGARRSVIAPPWRETDSQREAGFWQQVFGLEGLPPVTQVQMWDLEFYLPNDMLVKIDRASMSVSLESRVPLLCPRLAELAFQIPESQRYNPTTSKPLLRITARRYGPSIAAAEKQGFSIPRREWMRQAATEEVERSMVAGPAVRDGILHPPGIHALFQSVRRKPNRWLVDRSEELFSLLVFHHWWECHRP